MRALLIILLTILLMATPTMALSRDQLLASLDRKLPPPPRLLLLGGQEAALREKIARDAQLSAVWELVLRSADAILEEPLVKHEVVGRRLLGQSRHCLRRLTHLGLAYRLTGEQRYAERAREEMLAAAGMPDWNPSHFLDTAEMTAALAIGVDWLHDGLDEATRAAVRDAIVSKGLEASQGKPGWATSRNNWNQVCNAGMALGALVVADEHRELAAEIIQRSIEGVPHAMREYEPAGAYPEGPSYWSYGTDFNVLLIAALQQALGSDFGLLDHQGFAKTADYYLHVRGPSGLWFNYADASQMVRFHPSVSMQYLAAWQKRPELLFYERRMLEELAADSKGVTSSNRLLPLLLVWAESAREAGDPAELSFVAGGMTPVALFRSSWRDDATFAGIKGGQASGPHGHMDAGTFVVDMLGIRWAEDLGMENYHALESRGLSLWDRSPGSDRWKIFRIGARSHNVLIVNDQDHVLNGRAEIVASTRRSAELDLSPVYAGQLASASRELRLEDDGRVTISDKLQATDQGANVRWAMLTRAQVRLEPDGATLTRDGQQVRLRVRGVKDLEMQTWVSDPPPAEYDSPNPGTTILGFTTSLAADQSQNWTIEFIPQ